ncbi:MULTISPECIES: LysR family transcriptional regulator [unclassified Brenneria]|uniref:LysR family transcriptional regulator n=1 Tax=unclassified Brenneria TaxID=2634434 RepID=UPI0018F0BC03|nr:LysR family transcriptional regulator [Brenneria sp. L3-3C-1]MBJ7221050.1 LysR family transcriptional regulator [Brenneria sp. L3-3C-1]MEE3642291.1 LysR family transcriptional regulator [Brenneria sp. L3_3C_1]
MFELSQLRCFTAVATELSFRRAAQRLNMTQPPLSRQIQMLEHQLGVQLFERSTRSVKLTAAGRAFLTQANPLLEQAHHAAQIAKRVSLGEIGNVTLSFVSCAIYAYLPTVINQVRLKYPQLNIQLKEMSSSEQLNGLRTRQIDIGVIRAYPLDADFNSDVLINEPFLLAIPADHPLAEIDNIIPAALLHQQPFIIYSPSGWQPFYELIAGTFHRCGIQPNYEHSAGSTSAILSMVNGGLGLALVPSGSEQFRLPNVVFRKLDMQQELRSELRLVWRKDSDNPALFMLAGILRESVGVNCNH